HGAHFAAHNRIFNPSSRLAIIRSTNRAAHDALLTLFAIRFLIHALEPTHPAPVAGRRRRPYTATSGALLAAAPIPWAVATWSFESVLDPPVWAAAVAIATTISLLAAGLLVTRNARLGRLLGSAGLAGLLALASPRLADSPGITLLLG